MADKKCPNCGVSAAELVYLKRKIKGVKMQRADLKRRLSTASALVEELAAACARQMSGPSGIDDQKAEELLAHVAAWREGKPSITAQPVVDKIKAEALKAAQGQALLDAKPKIWKRLIAEGCDWRVRRLVGQIINEIVREIDPISAPADELDPPATQGKDAGTEHR